jgi:hypothetical protein
MDAHCLEKIRRETIRWFLLVTMNTSRPVPLSEEVALSVIQLSYPNATREELRKCLDYLEARQLATIDKQPDGRWLCDLTRFGIDVVEYTVPVEPGIARPQRG